MASLLAIYEDRELRKKWQSGFYDICRCNEACLTTKNGNSKNLLSCLEALHIMLFIIMPKIDNNYIPK